jgi:acetyl-CoA synthetase
MTMGRVTSSDAVWTPHPELVARAHVTRLAKSLGIDNFDDLYRFSLERPDEYWAGNLRFLQIQWFRAYEQYVDLGRGLPFPKWFVGGRLNWVETALWRARDPTTRANLAVITEREDGRHETLTYGQLLEQVENLARGLRSLGIARGDRVGLLMPSGAEAIISFVSLSYIGAIAVPLFTGFGVDAVVSRLSSSGARALIAVNGFRRRQRRIDMQNLAFAARQQVPHLEQVILKRYEDRGEISAGIIDWDDIVAKRPGPTVPCEQMDPNAPFMIIFTSGTTGAPKGTVHTHGGFPLKITHDSAVHFDLGPGDVWFWPADMGWVVGPITAIGALMRGATLVCYDGAPDFPDRSRIARIVERYRVTHFGASPTLIRSLAAAGCAESLPCAVDISSLKLLITAGEVIDQEHFRWFLRSFGRGTCPVINYTGGTEVSGALLANVVVRPIIPAGFNAASPAIAIDVADDEGRPVVDAVGELVIRGPFVGMTRSFWNDDDRYLQTYWSRFPATWVHGDFVMRTASATPGACSYVILGRSDDTLKIAGKRLGPAEVEEIALGVRCVAEAAAIGVDDPQKGQQLVLFVVAESTDIGEAIMVEVEAKLGRPFRPARVHVVTQLPKTKNGKTLRRLIKRIYCGETAGDLSALDNPRALEEIQLVGRARNPV